ncbi:MAG: sugar phosphate isomerase/epimerase family protein [Candidatus Hodarchaeota archaeon]
MKLGFSINAFAGKKWTPFPQKPLKIIADAGFKNVELVFDKPYFWLQDLELKRAAEIKTFLKKLKLNIVDVSSCTAGGYYRPDSDVAPPGQRFGPSFASASERTRQTRIEHVKKVVDFSVLLNCYDINSSTGYQPKNRTRKDSWKDVKECYREVCAYAAKRDAWINIEYEPGKYGPGGLFIANAGDTMKMISEVGANNLGANLDLGHAFVCGENLEQIIKMFAKEKVLRHIHLEDIKEREDGTRIHFHEIPGHGNMPLKKIFETLQKVDYKGGVTLELYSLWDKDPEKAAYESYNYLMKNFGKFLR